MAANVTDANTYISANCIDIEDWVDSDDAKKQRIVNVAGRTLSTRYPTYTIPDAAVYEFANVLATAFNDTNRLAKQGVSSFSIGETASFNFSEKYVTSPDFDAAKLIPKAALDLIGTANGVTLSKRRVYWSVM